ncbi:MAG: PilN domain-containing protein [Syntrophomonadaceae bacterium]|jgi:Tfp pilus assembly protein PilN
MLRHSILINLLEVDLSKVRKKKLILTTSAVITAWLVVLVSIYWVSINSYHKQQVINQDLTGQLAQYYKRQNTYQFYEDFIKEFNAKADTINEVEAWQISYKTVLMEISNIRLPDMTIENVKMEPGKLSINGTASNFEDVSHFLSGLRKKPLLNDVKMVLCEANNDGNITTFRIETGWEAKAQ